MAQHTYINKDDNFQCILQSCVNVHFEDIQLTKKVHDYLDLFTKSSSIHKTHQSIYFRRYDVHTTRQPTLKFHELVAKRCY